MFLIYIYIYIYIYYITTIHIASLLCKTIVNVYCICVSHEYIAGKLYSKFSGCHSIS